MTMKSDLYFHELIGRQKISFISRPSDWIDVAPVLDTEEKFSSIFSI